MPFHHVAISTRDLAATHEFYTEAMGFTLARVDAVPTPESAYGDGDGWAKHAFFDTGGGQCLAVWEYHDDEHLPTDFNSSLSGSMGLPPWTNHLAFDAPSLDVLETNRDRWIARGLPVVQVDHGWCVSIYAEDPNGNTVEFCCTTGELHTAGAEAILRDPAPRLEAGVEPQFFVPEGAPAG